MVLCVKLFQYMNYTPVGQYKSDNCDRAKM